MYVRHVQPTKKNMPAKKKIPDVSQDKLIMSRTIPNNGFIWMSKIINQHGEIVHVEAIIDANGIQSVKDIKDGSSVNLNGLLSLNRKNVLFIPEAIAELWHRYGFSKRA